MTYTLNYLMKYSTVDIFTLVLDSTEYLLAVANDRPDHYVTLMYGFSMVNWKRPSRSDTLILETLMQSSIQRVESGIAQPHPNSDPVWEDLANWYSNRDKYVAPGWDPTYRKLLTELKPKLTKAMHGVLMDCLETTRYGNAPTEENRLRCINWAKGLETE